MTRDLIPGDARCPRNISGCASRTHHRAGCNCCNTLPSPNNRHTLHRSNPVFREAVMLYLVYLIAQYRQQARARAVAANDTDVRRAA
ncbi:hypothetical protein FHS97_000903 [Sphingomonas endophytica]|uniref:Uncharacterized protein n=1 Tax=Sphingomonas endophytica TaxID=869719 RepID=A0ABR6N2I4_9SPHN|nr:hypothetical protein [Sphingomonas endophytica]MBB5724995.1 hypothetical protein [Sphingomonas endophytica]